MYNIHIQCIHVYVSGMYIVHVHVHVYTCTCLIRTCTLEECMYVRAGAERGREGLGLVLVCWGETQEGGKN